LSVSGDHAGYEVDCGSDPEIGLTFSIEHEISDPNKHQPFVTLPRSPARKISDGRGNSPIVLEKAGESVSPGNGVQRQAAGSINHNESPITPQALRVTSKTQKSPSVLKITERHGLPPFKNLEGSVAVQRGRHTHKDLRSQIHKDTESWTTDRAVSGLGSVMKNFDSKPAPTSAEPVNCEIRTRSPNRTSPESPTHLWPHSLRSRDYVWSKNPFESPERSKTVGRNRDSASNQDRNISPVRLYPGLGSDTINPTPGSIDVSDRLADNREDIMPPFNLLDERISISNEKAGRSPQENRDDIFPPFNKAQSGNIYPPRLTALSSEQGSVIFTAKNESSVVQPTFVSNAGRIGINSGKTEKPPRRSSRPPNRALSVIPERPERSFARETQASRLRRRVEDNESKRTEIEERGRCRHVTDMNEHGAFEKPLNPRNRLAPPAKPLSKQGDYRKPKTEIRGRCQPEPKTPERRRPRRAVTPPSRMYQLIGEPVSVYDRLLEPTVASARRARSANQASIIPPQAPQTPHHNAGLTVKETIRRPYSAHCKPGPAIKFINPDRTPTSVTLKTIANQPRAPAQAHEDIETTIAILSDPWRKRGNTVFDLCRILKRHYYLDIQRESLNAIHLQAVKVLQEARAVHEGSGLAGFSTIEEIRGDIPKRMESIIEMLTQVMIVVEGKGEEKEANQLFEIIKSAVTAKEETTNKYSWITKEW
jgi:hypothetical protein